MTPDDRSVAAAAELMRLGVSRVMIVDLLVQYPIERIERQLKFLPMRKCRRPEAFIVEAIRNDYSAPNPYRHAKAQSNASRKRRPLDEDPELAA